MKTFYIKGTAPKWKLIDGAGHPFPILSWIIRFFTWFDISHVLYDFHDLDEVFHVYLTEVRCEPRLKFLNGKVDINYIFEIKVEEDLYNKMLKKLKDSKGEQKGYYLQLLGIAMVAPFRLFGIKLSNPLKRFYGNSVTCSEHIARTFKEVFEVDWFDHIPLSTQTERDTIEILDFHRGNHRFIKVRRLR